MASKSISVESLVITEFRRFHDVHVDFIKPVTLIIGQNGTAKSTLLGMLAQPFSFGSEKEKEKLDASAYLANYHGLGLFDYADIAGNSYTYPCDKIFRLSKKHDTPNKRYLYETKLSGLDFSVDTTSPLKSKKLLTVQQTRAGKIRFVTGPGSSEKISHNSGEGNFPHPVIYLSLGRLLPLAEVKDCEISQGQGKLDSSESKWYVDAYKAIFSVIDETPNSGLMDTKEKKRSIVPLTETYDGESCSAGQDNIGRLLTAVLSFRRLKKSLGDRYRGGLLLIDEVDATLHPASQVKLMELLCKEAADLSLQIVATTHSMYLAETCLTALKKSVGVVQVKKSGTSLGIKSDATIDDIRADLKNIAIPPPKRRRKRKISVVLEDSEAVRLFRFLVAQRKALKSRLSVANIKGKKSDGQANSLSGQYLKIFAENAGKIPELQNVIFIPDGDMAWAKMPRPKNPNVVALPGTKPIEVQIFELLKNLEDDDSFWCECLGTNYCKQVAIGNHTSLSDTDIKGVKKWYGNQKPHWGRGLEIVFGRYYLKHRAECDDFLLHLENAISRCEHGWSQS